MSDTRTLVVSMIGTGIAGVTVVVAFMAILASGINTRIDDLNATVNARIDDVNTRIGNVETDLRELRALVIEAIKADEPPND